jgi:ligand-binding SRPBCC domain-containing protein
VRFHHRFRVAAPLSAVADFHCRAESLRAITPPLLPMRFEGEVPERLAPGDEIRFVLHAGPLPLVRWHAVIEALAEGEGFADRQVAGPFAHWLHRHRFLADGSEATFVDDEIEARLARSPWRFAQGAGMWLTLPLLFAYRARKTRRLLEG